VNDRPANPRRAGLPLRRLSFVLCTSLGLTAQAQQPAPPVDPYAAVRAEFVQQLSALEAMPAPQLAGSTGEASDALRGYMLYPYLEAQRLRMPMRYGLAPDDTAIAALLGRDGDAPWTRDLRRDWLLDLARRQRWPDFIKHYANNRADARLKCERLRALTATPPAEPAALAQLQDTLLGVWMTGSQLPDACVAPFEWARGQGWLTPERNERRARLALEAGNADLALFLLKSLPPEAAPPLRGWARLLGNPDREIDALIAGGPALINQQEPAAIAAAVIKISRRDPLAAAPRVNALIAACGSPCPLASPATPGELRREVALGHAWSRLPGSVTAFQQVDLAALDERAHEWRVRAALWIGQWSLAASWIDQMPATLAAQPRWRYWKARARAAKGDAEGAKVAKDLYEGLLAENGYYPLLAAGRLGRGFTPTQISAPQDPALQRQLVQQPGVQRARELWLAGRSEWSSLEWGETLASLTPAQAMQAARLPGTWNAWVQTVTAASKAQVFDDFELLYPRPFESEVQAAAKLSGVPSQWIFAVMRQESLYDPRARSRADALGLLQMLVSTARETARRQGQPAPDASALLDPAVNTRLGALHLKELLDRYEQEFMLVLGAYNAGPRPVQRWRPPTESLDADVWIENVPYNETRSYIQRVTWHSAVFGWRATGQPQSADKLLKPITPGG
jgi:soluble lytic murein transglycosylase